MSYFKKIVERTLKVEVNLDSELVKPAITPESIPEPFKTNVRAGTRMHRITAYSTNGSAIKKQPDEAPRPAVEVRQPEQLLGTAAAAAAAAPVSPAKQASQAAPEDKTGATDPIMMLDNEEAELSPTEKEKKANRDFVAAAFSTAAPVVLHAAIEVAGEADSASETKPLDHRGIVTSDSPRPKHHPQLRPATGAEDDKYSMAGTQPDETTVTINIGRIEVRAVSPPVFEARSLLPKEYSPPLSLDEYLKQRMEGKKK